RRTKARTARRKSLGQCVSCGEPRAEGIVHCRRCRPLSETVAAIRHAVQERRLAKEEERMRARLLARKHLGVLTARQREVIALRMVLDRYGMRSGAEVGAMLGISRQAVSVAEKAAWRRIYRAEAAIESGVEKPGHSRHTRVVTRSTARRAA